MRRCVVPVREPRFVFVELDDDEPTDLLSDDDAGERVRWRIGWRLVGRNNRELGRGAASFEAYEPCRAAVLALQRASLEAAIAPDDVSRWRWTLLVDDRPAAMCGRAYLRRVECEYGLDQFLAHVPLAAVAERVYPHRQRRRNGLSVLDGERGRT